MDTRIAALIARLVPGPGGCLLWPGAKDTSGYGRASVHGRFVAVHRAIYEAVVAPVDRTLDMDHLCRVRACANVLHLEPVTRRENLARGSHPLRERTSCVNGHSFTPDNVSPSDKTRRRCLTCQREAVARYTARKRATVSA